MQAGYRASGFTVPASAAFPVIPLPLRDSAGLSPVFPHCAPRIRASGAPASSRYAIVTFEVTIT